jgi:hypothetical protein
MQRAKDGYRIKSGMTLADTDQVRHDVSRYRIKSGMTLADIGSSLA